MFGAMRQQIIEQLNEIREAGLYKAERVITTPQDAHIGVAGGQRVLNMCANNYLGLAEHPEVVQAAHETLDRWGYGMASVRFICGTQQIHKDLESRISEFLGTEDTILYTSCFDANGGLFETLLGAGGCGALRRLEPREHHRRRSACAKPNGSATRTTTCEDLEAQLQAAKDARFRMIATDGVFSMDGYIANLPAICDLAEKYDALVMVDDSHAVGFMGQRGRGTHEYHNVMDRVDILTGTLGKALGGASGGYTSGRKEIIELLRQRSRPYLFSNTVAPAIVGASLRALELLMESTELRDRLEANTKFFRARDGEVGLSDPARRASDLPDHARRRGPRDQNGRRPVGEGHLRDRVFLSGRARRPSPHPHPNLRRPYQRRPGVRHRPIHRRRQRLGDLLTDRRGFDAKNTKRRRRGRKGKQFWER